MNDTRNLNPTLEAKIATTIWGKEYSEQNGGSMDFWDSLGEMRQRRCQFVAEEFAKEINELIGEDVPLDPGQKEPRADWFIALGQNKHKAEMRELARSRGLI